MSIKEELGGYQLFNAYFAKDMVSFDGNIDDDIFNDHKIDGLDYLKANLQDSLDDPFGWRVIPVKEDGVVKFLDNRCSCYYVRVIGKFSELSVWDNGSVVEEDELEAMGWARVVRAIDNNGDSQEFHLDNRVFHSLSEAVAQSILDEKEIGMNFLKNPPETIGEEYETEINLDMPDPQEFEYDPVIETAILRLAVLRFCFGTYTKSQLKKASHSKHLNTYWPLMEGVEFSVDVDKIFLKTEDGEGTSGMSFSEFKELMNSAFSSATDEEESGLDFPHELNTDLGSLN